jgi:Domain of unknown function (DUF4129)
VGAGWGAQLRAGVAIAVGLLLALVATVGPAPSPSGEAGASLVIRLPDLVRTAVLTLLALSALLLLALQRPSRPREDDPAAARAYRRRSGWAAVLVPLPILLLVAAAWYLARHPWSPQDGHPFERAFTAIAGLLDLLASARKPPTSVPAFDLTIAGLALLLAVGLFVLMLLVALAGPLEKWLAGRRAGVASPRASALVDRRDDPRAEADPRLAIVRAWGCFERAMAGARSPRAPWQTPAEFMRATLARLPVPASPVTRLTALFEVARFSDRRLDAEDREAACDCLDAITTALDEDTARER